MLEVRPTNKDLIANVQEYLRFMLAVFKIKGAQPYSLSQTEIAKEWVNAHTLVVEDTLLSL